MKFRVIRQYVKACVGAFLFLQALMFSSISLAENSANCDCEPSVSGQANWKEAFDSAEHVVFAEVKEIQIHADDLATATLEVLETFKGQTDYIKKVAGSAKEGSSCRKMLRPGFYILYSFGSNNVVLKQCSVSKQLNPKENLVATLGEIHAYIQSKEQTTQKVLKEKESSQEVEDLDWLQSIINWFG